MIQITANTIAEFQVQAIIALTHSYQAYKQRIDRGSFEKGDTYRLQATIVGEILTPWIDTVPVPPGKYWNPDDTMEACINYFTSYILGGLPVGPNEDYTYAERIARGDQLSNVMEMLKKTPNTNQACITIAAPEDTYIHDPACLRHIDFKYVDGELVMHVYWRSHDLFRGFPKNMVGLHLLHQSVAEYAELKQGKICYYSSGAHVYSYQLDAIK